MKKSEAIDPMPRCVILAVLVMGMWVMVARACNVPVFRYAMLWWGARTSADCYQVMVFHHGPFTDSQQALIARLQENAWLRGEGANYVILPVDLDGEVPEAAVSIWAAQDHPVAPWIVLRYPAGLGKTRAVWAGELNASNVDLLLNSPVRREIARRLLAGETAVWLLLESGDPALDDAAARRLTDRLTRLEKNLRLPVEADDSIDAPDDGGQEVQANHLPPLRIAFSVIRVSRDDPRERVLRRILQRSEDDLETEFANEPMAFPVFGRGRSLWGLVGGGINDELITQYCVYVVGRCSCQIKRINPGFDLLLDTAWDQLLEAPPAEALTIQP